MTTREQIVEIVNRLFVYTDEMQWNLLQNEVFTNTVHFDMSSLGGINDEISAKQICDMWAEGFKEIDAVNHLAGNYLVELDSDNEAKVFAYATATHFKESAKEGKTREFVGSYELGLKCTAKAWRIYSFKYNLKFLSGNIDLK